MCVEFCKMAVANLDNGLALLLGDRTLDVATRSPRGSYE
jgi:hypothetical protein